MIFEDWSHRFNGKFETYVVRRTFDVTCSNTLIYNVRKEWARVAASAGITREKDLLSCFDFWRTGTLGCFAIVVPFELADEAISILEPLLGQPVVVRSTKVAA